MSSVRRHWPPSGQWGRWPYTVDELTLSVCLSLQWNLISQCRELSSVSPLEFNASPRLIISQSHLSVVERTVNISISYRIRSAQLNYTLAICPVSTAPTTVQASNSGLYTLYSFRFFFRFQPLPFLSHNNNNNNNNIHISRAPQKPRLQRR